MLQPDCHDLDIRYQPSSMIFLVSDGKSVVFIAVTAGEVSVPSAFVREAIQELIPIPLSQTFFFRYDEQVSGRNCRDEPCRGQTKSVL